MNPALRTTWLSSALNLTGFCVVGWSLIASYAAHIQPAQLAIALTGLAGWLVAIVVSLIVSPPGLRPAALPVHRADDTVATRIVLVALAVCGLCGAFIAAPTFGLGIALTVVALLRIIGSPQWPLWWGVLLAVLSAALVALGAIALSFGGTLALANGLSPGGLLAIEGGVVISALGGVSRRQFRLSERQAEALREERLAALEKEAALATLSERQSIAREMHDVLAHSLGGLVIQLDAVEALLEAGQTQAATRRVADARELAASGLAEARRAVDALRQPEAAAPVAAADLLDSFEVLVTADRALGSRVSLDVERSAAGEVAYPTATTALFTSDAAHALRRLLQEALTNARKHAPGEPVTVVARVTGDSAELYVSNALSARSVVPTRVPALGSTGGGNGIAGMRERFTLLPGARFETTADDQQFAVSGLVPALPRRV